MEAGVAERVWSREKSWDCSGACSSVSISILVRRVQVSQAEARTMEESCRMRVSLSLVE